MADLFEDEQKLVFKLNKVAFHNSCKSNMVSIDFFENTHLSGSNGAGKSAKLNAIQVGFLPHCNFKDVKKKYYFISSKGNHYSDEESYEFHFPEMNSFIIYEFSNPHGTFCQIIYRGKLDLSIERAFVPMSLDDIYDWFWTFAENDEIGVPARITLKGLLEKIKDTKGSVVIKTTKDAKRYLYNGNILEKEGVYSIANVHDTKITNLLDLFKVTADASRLTPCMIKKTINSLIESSYINNTTDRLDFRPAELLSAFEQLEHDQKIINNKRNNEHHFHSITTSFNQLASLSTRLNNEFHMYYQNAKRLHDDAKSNESKIKLEIDSESTRLSKIQEEGRALDQKWRETDTILTEKKADNAKKKPDVKAYNELLFGDDSDLFFYHGDINKIDAALQDNINSNKKLLKNYQNFDKATAELLKERKEFDQLLQRESEIRTQLENIDNLLMANSQIKNPQTLASINSAMTAIKDNFEAHEIEILNNFSDLFQIKENKIYLKGTLFGSLRDIEFSKERLHYELDDIIISKDKLTESISNLERILGGDTLVEKARIQEELDASEKDLRLIRRVSSWIDEYNEKETDINELKEKVEIEKAKHKAHQDSYRKAKKKKEALSEDAIVFENDRKKYHDITYRLENLIKDEAYQYDSFKCGMTTVLDNVNPDIVYEMRRLFIDINGQRDGIRQSLIELVNNEIIKDENASLMRSTPNYMDLFKDLYSKLEIIYSTLDSDEEVLQNSMRSHADITLSMAKAIEHHKNHYVNYVGRLNKNLAEFKLSNIDGVRLKLDINPKVTDFIETIESLGVAGHDISESINKGLFAIIKDFIEDMNLSNQKNMALTGDQLVSAINIEYLVGGKWSNKDGSNGTSLTSSVMLLSLFIEELCGKTSTLSIPINLDETNNVDYSNMENICQFMKSKDLILFSASPDLPLGSDNIFKKFINFDDAVVSEPERLLSMDNKTTYHYQMGGFFDIEPLKELEA